MPFYVSYILLTGTRTRMAETAAGALVIYDELKDTGAGDITIRNEASTVYTADQLALAALLPRMTRDRGTGSTPRR
jgi:hypothetical protein